MLQLLLTLTICGLLSAQQPPSQDKLPTFVGGTKLITAPVLVYDHQGNYVNGLQPSQFHLFDNQKSQDISVDVSYIPISMVICLQVNSHVEGLLPQIRKIGNLIEPLIVGEQGQVAVIGYDSRIRVLQDFTSDSGRITEAVRNIYPGSRQNRMIDAVMTATQMLSHMPNNRRRVILLIGETRDGSSEHRLSEVLTEMELKNVMLYAVDMSRLASTLTAKMDPGRPLTLPPAMYGQNLPPFYPNTPTSVAFALQQGIAARAQFLPLLIEVFKDVKSIWVDNPVEAFTKGTGGSEFGYYKQRGLEEAIERIGAELHSQYLVTYRPNNMGEGGFHEITVTISTPTATTVQTRPGYWISGVK
jgi:VWFA-related protein